MSTSANIRDARRAKRALDSHDHPEVVDVRDDDHVCPGCGCNFPHLQRPLCDACEDELGLEA